LELARQAIYKKIKGAGFPAPFFLTVYDVSVYRSLNHCIRIVEVAILKDW
jgi:hypothetical protein